MVEIANHIHDLKRGVDFIGVGVVFICHDGHGRVLLHKRSNKCRDEHGRWNNGGGAVEFGEDLDTAVRREVMEEYGVEPIELKYLEHKNVIRQNGDHQTHWVAMRYSVLVDPEKVINGDPEKIDEFGWFTLDNLPTPLHGVLANELELVKKVLGV
ncbi:MAG: NUDIX hydrolase [bacterium]|nr:NUDIX hydrolase [bacterium]